MRKKLLGLAAVAMLLTGCSAPQDGPSTEPTEPSADAAGPWDDMTFCQIFNEKREAYQSALEGDGDQVVLSDLDPFKDWADALKSKASEETAEDAATFTGPLYLTENATVNLVDVFMAGNSIAGDCIGQD